MTVAVVAHRGKSIGGGLDELRSVLTDAGISEPLWFEVPKSKKAPKRVREAVRCGADLIFVWGGDGMVQRTADALAGSDTPMAVVPAGTANLLATNLGIPSDIAECVKIGLSGTHRRIDLGRFNGEHFTVMAGVGFDARMIRDADAGLKDRIGRLAYIWTGAKNLKAPRVRARIKVDGERWLTDEVACILVGNVGSLFSGITVFENARPDDGRLEVGVVTAKSATEWMRALASTAAGRPERSPFVHLTSGKKISIRLAASLPYELDGGDRAATDRIRVRVQPLAATFCVPDEEADR
jgi:diacylglycerol kinase (ATP)